MTCLQCGRQFCRACLDESNDPQYCADCHQERVARFASQMSAKPVKGKAKKQAKPKPAVAPVPPQATGRKGRRKGSELPAPPVVSAPAAGLPSAPVHPDLAAPQMPAGQAQASQRPSVEEFAPQAPPVPPVAPTVPQVVQPPAQAQPVVEAAPPAPRPKAAAPMQPAPAAPPPSDEPFALGTASSMAPFEPAAPSQAPPAPPRVEPAAPAPPPGDAVTRTPTIVPPAPVPAAPEPEPRAAEASPEDEEKAAFWGDLEGPRRTARRRERRAVPAPIPVEASDATPAAVAEAIVPADGAQVKDEYAPRLGRRGARKERKARKVDAGKPVAMQYPEEYDGAVTTSPSYIKAVFFGLLTGILLAGAYAGFEWWRHSGRWIFGWVIGFAVGVVIVFASGRHFNWKLGVAAAVISWASLCLGQMAFSILDVRFNSIIPLKLPFMTLLNHAAHELADSFTSPWVILFIITGAVAFLVSFRPWPIKFQISASDRSGSVQSPSGPRHVAGPSA